MSSKLKLNNETNMPVTKKKQYKATCHSGSKYCSVDINIPEESKELWRTIGQIVEWAFDATQITDTIINF